MQAFIPGQRWISESEPELGLGSVLGQDGRLVRIEFPATGETRSYAADAPLSRVRFAPGDLAESAEGWQLRVAAVRERGGLLIYQGEREDGHSAELSEQELNSFMQLRSPAQRLLNGLTDPPHWFALRHRALDHQARNQRSPLRGLLGARIAPIPHQLYIAQEVARRQTPRVLLADEVGLGKTIEAGLILHRQLLTGRARRVLVLVPEPLLHQWLVELLRRFNLRFSLFDQERCEAIVASGQAENPFLAEQLVLCPLPLVSGNDGRRAQALAGDWDLLVVDEAHHLAWERGGRQPRVPGGSRAGGGGTRPAAAHRHPGTAGPKRPLRPSAAARPGPLLRTGRVSGRGGGVPAHRRSCGPAAKRQTDAGRGAGTPGCGIGRCRTAWTCWQATHRWRRKTGNS